MFSSVPMVRRAVPHTKVSTDGQRDQLPSMAQVALNAGRSLAIQTAGGGGYGPADTAADRPRARPTGDGSATSRSASRHSRPSPTCPPLAEAAGTRLADAAPVTVYLRDPRTQAAEFDVVYRQALGDPAVPPARPVVQSDLPHGDIEVTAVVPIPPPEPRS
jgi:hypothetical protein